jgi:methylmalonyl-CoA mutase
MHDPTLGAEFPAATREQWLKLVEGVLKGADFEQKLVARTYDRIRIEPLYDKAERAEQILRSEGRWRIAQRVDHPDLKAANDLALADLEGGADALTLVFPDAAGARGFGLGARTADDLDRALRGVQLDLVQLRLDAGHAGFDAAALVADLGKRRGHALSELDLDLGLDPIGAMASGRMLDAWDEVAARCAETLSRLSAQGLRGCAFLADGRPYHEAGAAEAQELAAVLATGIAYLRALEAGGHGLEAARDALSFLLVADADEFLTVAKFRALRRLWARIEEACGLSAKPVRLHAETAWRMTTRRDPWVNMLRATVAVFSAGLGGADTVTALPFTAALGLSDAFARRMARNTQLILMEEASLWRVADPAAGAGGFEALTDALCDTAWRLFQDIEREDGIVASLEAGVLQARIAAVRAQRQRAVATRQEPITGTSEFPHLAETEVAVLLPSPLRGGVGGGGRDEVPAGENEHQTVTSAHSGASASAPAHQAERPPSPTLPRRKSGVPDLRIKQPISGKPEIGGGESRVTPLPSIRIAEPYERLRDISDAQLARTGARPKIFLANFGPPAAFTARAAFARNLFEAGGIQALSNDGFSRPEEAAEAFSASEAKLACLCSSDDIYARHAASAATALRKAGAREVYLAGPEHLAEAIGTPEVSRYVFAGCDALAILSHAIAKAAT